MTEPKPKPLIRATEPGGRSIDDPSDDAVHDLLADMNLSHRVVIVRRLDREPVDEHYMQVYLNDDFSYHVEYREGSEDRHFQAEVPWQGDMIGPRPVAAVISDWMHERQGWREALPWVPWPSDRKQTDGE